VWGAERELRWSIKHTGRANCPPAHPLSGPIKKQNSKKIDRAHGEMMYDDLALSVGPSRQAPPPPVPTAAPYSLPPDTHTERSSRGWHFTTMYVTTYANYWTSEYEAKWLRQVCKWRPQPTQHRRRCLRPTEWPSVLGWAAIEAAAEIAVDAAPRPLLHRATTLECEVTWATWPLASRTAKRRKSEKKDWLHCRENYGTSKTNSWEWPLSIAMDALDHVSWTTLPSIL